MHTQPINFQDISVCQTLGVSHSTWHLQFVGHSATLSGMNWQKYYVLKDIYKQPWLSQVIKMKAGKQMNPEREREREMGRNNGLRERRVKGRDERGVECFWETNQ